MKRLKLFILLFFIAVSFPLAFVIWQTFGVLEKEERSQLRFFSETIFDQMEKELADLVQREENRAVDEYRHFLAQSREKGRDEPQLSPLAQLNYPDYILGYLQNNPDGSFLTPLVNDLGLVSQDKRPLVSQLRQANQAFELKKFSISQQAPEAALPDKKNVVKGKEEDSFSERYLQRSKNVQSKTYLGKKTQRVEEITVEQALNISSDVEAILQDRGDEQKWRAPAPIAGRASKTLETDEAREENEINVNDYVLNKQKMVLSGQAETTVLQEQFQVEVAPFQSVAINDDYVYIFRRIEINKQIYRQGFILQVESLMRHLIASHFTKQPLAGFTALQMQRRDNGAKRDIVQAGVSIPSSDFLTERIFPPPFDFLSVTLKAKNIPSSPVRRYLNVALVVLAMFMFLGFLAIYQSAHTIIAMSERRSQFVSAVTHELKTPLTNIRMYIEMLEQGIAATPEREQEYLTILGSESTRLSGLINNVLELAKLEKKQRQFHMQEGQLEDVFTEVETIMLQKLKQDGFSLVIKESEVPKFFYDKDVLIQILMNLIENSVKFGKKASIREITITADSKDNHIQIAVSDTGPGIPRHALKKIFDDFYRVDSDLTRTTGGTGIGLSLVKKFIIAMGGSVRASNNTGPGCTITLLLPINSPAPGTGHKD